MKIRFEQFRQATRIHGSLAGMLAASVGVRLSRCPVPTVVRGRVYRSLYGGKYPALDERELEKPLAEFRSINELFTRGVRADLRPIAEEAESRFVSPCDSTVQSVGTLTDETVLTVKQTRYRLSSLAPLSNTDSYRHGCYAVLFLSPRDCHRVFSPADGTLAAVTHVPGRRLLVHPEHQRSEFPVFTLNERLVLESNTSSGRCLLILVAGWGVGHITHPFRTGLRPRRRRITRMELAEPRHLRTGDWLATFELGSSVVFVAESHEPLVPQVSTNESLHYGQSLFRTKDKPARDPS